MSDLPTIMEVINEKEALMNETPDFNYEPPTEEEIAKAISHPVLTHLNSRLENLQSQLTASQDSVMRLRDKYRKAEYAITDLLKEMIGDDDITPENAQRIADIFDNVILSKRISIRYDIVATVEVEVPFGTDEDEVADNTYCDRVAFENYLDNSEVLEVDFDVTDWNVVS